MNEWGQLGTLPHSLNYDWGTSLYPMWGYPAWLEIFGLDRLPQVALFAIMLWLTYRTFRFEWWHIPLWFPSFVSVYALWSDALATSLLLGVFAMQKKAPIVSAIFLGLTANFRFEYLMFAPVLKKYGLIVLLMLGPWFARSYFISGSIGGSTNGGHVAFISLGQLPNNPWGIQHLDEFGYAQSKHKAFSAEYDREMRGKFMEAIVTHPLAYVTKVLHNAVVTFTHGVYTGGILKYMYAMTVVGLLVWHLLNRKPISAFFWIKVALMCLLQTEPRHLNAVIPLLFLEER